MSETPVRLRRVVSAEDGTYQDIPMAADDLVPEHFDHCCAIANLRAVRDRLKAVVHEQAVQFLVDGNIQAAKACRDLVPQLLDLPQHASLAAGQHQRSDDFRVCAQTILSAMASNAPESVQAEFQRYAEQL